MTKADKERRERIATAVLSALAAAHGVPADPSEMARRAVRMADALIAGLDSAGKKGA